MLSRQFQGELDLLTLHHHDPQRFPFLLESVSTSPLSRYSILFAYPQQTLRMAVGSTGFLQALDQLWQQHAATIPPPTPALAQLPFRGGWFLYLAYELAGEIEPVLQLAADPQQLPMAVAVRIPVAVLRDHVSGQLTVLAEPQQATAFAELCRWVEHCLQQAPTLAAMPLPPLTVVEDEPDRFKAGVARIRDYIQAGDVFQVNLSRAWHSHLAEAWSPVALYQRLRQANPAPFAALADFGDFALVSSSPERLVRVRDGVVDIRPIAGTRPRGSDVLADTRQLQELIAHPKERAEHIMLIDLGRNDLGRLCRYGSVRVDELMVLESYQHVHHIVSNIRGTLLAGRTPGQVIRAVFPGGTITGCPKVRCMEIIAELEQTGRGAYTGSLGYLNHDGSMDLNILIRTLSVRAQHLLFRTGAGIVMDSQAELELLETRHKARGLLRALGDTVS